MKAKANPALAAPGRAALYLRVSTGRQAEHDLSIHDQRRQLRAYCEAKGIEVVAEFVAPGTSATDDRRPEFQRMMDAASEKPAPFDTIIVHSFFHKSPARLPRGKRGKVGKQAPAHSEADLRRDECVIRD